MSELGIINDGGTTVLDVWVGSEERYRLIDGDDGYTTVVPQA